MLNVLLCTSHFCFASFLCVSAVSAKANIAYIGCFSLYHWRARDSFWRRADSTISRNVTTIDPGRRGPSWCLRHCRAHGMRFAALTRSLRGRFDRIPYWGGVRRPALSKNETFCSCGQTYGQYSRMDDSSCNPPCDDDRSRRCGSKTIENYAVYQAISDDEMAICKCKHLGLSR